MHPIRKRKLAATATVLVAIIITVVAAITAGRVEQWQTYALQAIALAIFATGALSLESLNRKDHQ